ncbi:cell cycle regulatory protein [Conidiobolus coronatus NRRL 28638]|uniref:Cyclin-dependent kinases regulatory subunit n=1 Tax=Conidiobolus coronatus (strain ATCC 28846 / CBS 209.66 / NRRL 28638) TaxID=796925 RepID=A0A137P7X9_CONC2|nr:cell cycle regulatory protein [Conidiobolus coronatus NRRL 28638]|eukprot:KXN71127.1 cell cycle regulatory protein [Conidiobolus coronatus NRRL 28638]
MKDEEYEVLINEYKAKRLIKNEIPTELILDINYSPYYTHGDWNYRIVSVPKKLLKYIPRNTLLTNRQWQSVGIIMSDSWEHYQLFEPEPQSMMFRKYVGSQKSSGKAPIPDPQVRKPVVPVPSDELDLDELADEEQSSKSNTKKATKSQSELEESKTNKRKAEKSHNSSEEEAEEDRQNKQIKKKIDKLQPSKKSKLEDNNSQDDDAPKPRRSARISK